MRTQLLISTIAMALIASVCNAAPIIGSYEMPDMLMGHWTESFVGGSEAAVGNEIAAGSWDGAVLGSQWELSGVTLLSDTEVSNIINGGLQVIQYSTIYTGGTLTLAEDTGLWTGQGADGDYDITLTSFTQSTSVTLFNGDVLIVAGAISMQGTFDGWAGYEMNYLAASTSIDGEGVVAPAEYPALSAGSGQWGQADDVQLRIVPEPMTLSLLAVGALAGMRRRRR